MYQKQLSERSTPLQSRLTFIACTILSLAAAGCSFMPNRDNGSQKIAAIQAECQAAWMEPEFDPIRDKVELRPTSGGGLFKFNDDYATRSEKPIIKKFAALLDDCQGRTANVLYVTNPAMGMRSINRTNDEVNQLILLHNGKITWGQFTERRYAIINNQAGQQISEDQRKHEEHMRESNRRQQKILEDNARRSAEEAQQIRNSNAHQIITTDCYPSSHNGFSCTTRAF